MENCAIYSHQLDFDKIVETVKQHLPDAKISVTENDLNKSLIASLSGGLFGKSKKLTINYRRRQTPSYQLDKIECALTQNLAGMANYVQSLPAKNTAVRDQLMYKIMAANTEIPFMAEPSITPEFEAVLRKLLIDLDAFVFTPATRIFNQSALQHFADKNGNLILDAEGNCNIDRLEVNVDAKYRDQSEATLTDDQRARKERSEQLLSSHGAKLNKNLPAVSAEADVKLRTVDEVVDRAYALLVVAAKGEGVEQVHLDRAIKDKRIDSFSPEEKPLIKAESLTEEQRAYATWRYESLNIMLWALGKLSDLPYPSDICNVELIVGLMFRPSRDEFRNSVKLRSVKEILDELDKTYRMNWACVDARIKGQNPDGNLHPGIVYERHYSLNWLTNFESADWDDVRTHT